MMLRVRRRNSCPATHRCPDNGATVDLSNCSISANLGAGILQAGWTDPSFDPSQGLYYVRVLENPSCRWSIWTRCERGSTPRRPAGYDPRAGVVVTHLVRA